MTEYKIYVGVPHGVTTDDAQEFIGSQLETGMTIPEASGVWDVPEALEAEQSLVITILSPDPAMPDLIDSFADAYAEEYDQMQVIWTTQSLLYTDREYSR
jgi:hypothetical protein